MVLAERFNHRNMRTLSTLSPYITILCMIILTCNCLEKENNGLDKVSICVYKNMCMNPVHVRKPVSLKPSNIGDGLMQVRIVSTWCFLHYGNNLLLAIKEKMFRKQFYIHFFSTRFYQWLVKTSQNHNITKADSF